ncbi:hypothetical protein NQZ79_g1807 [Umbelopsis isabellina]|nr:hypothetical protein NQZ79_g1807 [Umbelopsis isabellina]
MDPTTSTSPNLFEDNLASRQADAIEAGSILISLANSHKPSKDHQELEAAAIAMESMSKHPRNHSVGSLYSQPTHNNEHKKRPSSSSSMSIHNLLSDDRPSASSSTQPESPDIKPMETPSYRTSGFSDRNCRGHYQASPPATYKRPMDNDNYPMPNKRSSISSSVDHSYQNGRAVYRNSQEDPYRTRKDHRFNADAYHYDHMTHASNSSQQRQFNSHIGAPTRSRKSSMSTANHTQKYYIMKQSPKVKRNAMHAYISYTIYMDITRRASLKNQMIADDQLDRGHHYQHSQNSPTPTAIYNHGPDRNRKYTQPSYNRQPAPRNEVTNGNGDDSEYGNSRRRGSMTFTNMYPSPHPHEHYAEPAQPQSHYRSPALETSYPPQELLAQPLTAYLRERSNGQPR